MKSLQDNVEEIWPLWAEIAPLVLEQKIICANIENIKENLPKNFLEMITVWNQKFKNSYSSELNSDQKKIFEFIKKYKHQISNIISDEMEKTKNCFTIDFKYKGEYLNKLTIPVESISNNLLYLDYIVDEISLLLSSYVANEKITLNHLDDLPKWRNCYYQLFDVPKESLKLKLRIWKENYPLAYEKLIKVLEIPTLEELENEKAEKNL